MKTSLFIIHGWTYSLDKWADICKILEANDIEPILLKVPGLTEPSTQVWDIEGYVNWLDDKLKGYDKPIVMGHSNGGRIALSYVQTHPDRLGKLILMDSAGIANDAETKARTKIKVLRVIAKLGKPLGRVPIIKKVFYKLIGAQDYLNAPPNMQATMQNMLAADKAIDFSKIILPVTIIWGQNDTVTPLSDGRKMQTAIAGSELHVVEGAKHGPMATNSQQVADIVIEALKK